MTKEGQRLLQKLEVGERPEAVVQAARGSLPRNLVAARAYAEGIEALRRCDATLAPDRLWRASAAHPGSARAPVARALPAS